MISLDNLKQIFKKTQNKIKKINNFKNVKVKFLKIIFKIIKKRKKLNNNHLVHN